MRRNARQVNRSAYLGAVVALSLVAVTAQFSAASPQMSGSVPSTTATAEAVLERPDAVSAMVSAQAAGVRVEDVSQRSEETQVFANPEGTWTSESATEPVRVLDEAGAWREVDTTLVERDGGLAPRYASTEMVLSGGGDRTFAEVTAENGDPLGWRWPDVLPAPVVAGDTATYENVVEGGDLV